MKAFKYDGKIHYEQSLEFIKKDENHLVLKGGKGRNLVHHTRNAVYTFNDTSLEYFFIDRWYTAALVFNDSGEVISVYCNIAYPCVISENIVEFIDLDVDVIVKNGVIKVVDLDEFEDHKILYGYSKELEIKVFNTVNQLKQNIRNGIYPFNRDILKQT